MSYFSFFSTVNFNIFRDVDALDKVINDFTEFLLDVTFSPFGIFGTYIAPMDISPSYNIFDEFNHLPVPREPKCQPHITNSNVDTFVKTKKSNKNNVQKNKNNTESSVNHSYLNLNKNVAEQKARYDSNLEHLSGGQNWSVAVDSFKTDIPYAKNGTSKILDKVAKIVKQQTGQDLVITSALGTAGNGNSKTPHAIGGYASHHNADNPKLDIRTRGNGKQLASILKSTGFFSRVSIESDHLDVQIDLEKYQTA